MTYEDFILEVQRRIQIKPRNRLPISEVMHGFLATCMRYAKDADITLPYPVDDIFKHFSYHFTQTGWDKKHIKTLKDIIRDQGMEFAWGSFTIDDHDMLMELEIVEPSY